LSILLFISGLISDAFCSFSGNGEEISKPLQGGEINGIGIFHNSLIVDRLANG